MYTILNSSICGISRRRVTRNDANEQINEKDREKTYTVESATPPFLLTSLPKFSSPIFGLLAASNSDATRSQLPKNRPKRRERKKKREKESTFRRWKNAPSMIFGEEIIEIVGLCRIRL